MKSNILIILSAFTFSLLLFFHQSFFSLIIWNIGLVATLIDPDDILKGKEEMIFNKGISKLITIVFSIVVLTFGFFACYLSYKNDFSTEMREMLLTATGAVVVAFLFMFNKFYIETKHTLRTSIPVPIVLNNVSNEVFAPHSIKANSLPQENNFFKGLAEFNTLQMHNAIQPLKISHPKAFGPDKLEYLEFVFFQWLNREVNWLTESGSLVFSHNGYGGGHTMLPSNVKNSTTIRMETIDEPNLFFQASPTAVSFPVGAKVTREAKEHLTKYLLETSTGTFTLIFSGGGGGIFDENISSPLVIKLSNQIKNMHSVPLATELPQGNFSICYPLITLEYLAKSRYQFSNQAKREEIWFKKIEKSLYKDFSWDLLREYYSFGFESSLNLYRSHASNPERLDY